MIKKEICDKYSIDYKKGISRCMDDEELYSQMLQLFLEDDSFNKIKVAHEKHDLIAMFAGVHDLKGVSGNASLNLLYEASCKLVECLRGNKGENADELFDILETAYNNVKEGILLALS